MKKAKIMLSAIMVLAVVGGALAFRAKNISTTLFTIPDENNKCTTSQVLQTTSPGHASSGTISASTANGGVCTTFTLTTADN